MSFIKSIADAANHIKHAVIPKKKPEQQRATEGKTESVFYSSCDESASRSSKAMHPARPIAMPTLVSIQLQKKAEESAGVTPFHNEETPNNFLLSGEGANEATSAQ